MAEGVRTKNGVVNPTVAPETGERAVDFKINFDDTLNVLLESSPFGLVILFVVLVVANNIIFRKDVFFPYIYCKEIKIYFMNSVVTCKKKYPFISQFVQAMEDINAHNYVSESDSELKSLLVFFKLYVVSCRKLKMLQRKLSNDDIEVQMSREYDEWRNTLNERVKEIGQ